MNVSRGKTDVVGDLIAQVWGAYYAEDHRAVESLMARLKKASPYHSRELYNELNELITAQERV
jgi:DNA-binding response OmpR family regulator